MIDWLIVGFLRLVSLDRDSLSFVVIVIIIVVVVVVVVVVVKQEDTKANVDMDVKAKVYIGTSLKGMGLKRAVRGG